MATIGQFAKDYVPQQMENIADLDVVKTDVEIKTEVRHNNEKDEDYTVNFIVVDGKEYRVPISVVEQLQTIIKSKPLLSTFKVEKKGTGLSTKYQVIALD